MVHPNTPGNLDVPVNSTPPFNNVAILGFPKIAKALYFTLNKTTQPQHKVVGFISLKGNEKEGAEILKNSNELTNPNFLGRIDDVKSIKQKYKIVKVILAIDPRDFHTLHKTIQLCEREGIDYDVLPKSFDIRYEDVVQDIKEKDDEIPTQLWIQRPLDLIVSIMLFLLFLPSWLIIAIAIKLESSGSVLYSQERVGINGKTFRIYKFRSMYSDAEKSGAPQLATRNDPRITKIGLFLRKTRLDELPQLVNIIRGDMSLIGPRPERPYFVEKYHIEIPQYIKRLRVKPGLTGYAQVESGYDETLEDVKTKLKHDLHYIENRNSFKLYFDIIYKTVWVVLTAKGQ